MSGWIKVEKDLANDPRVLRMASRLSHADVTLGSRSRLVVVGALVTLWWYADTHISNDDVLAIGADEVDELVGLKGFCALMPPDWLKILDADHVQLIGYVEHNGSKAKNTALAQKRQQRHRAKPTSTSRSRHGDVTPSALPDKTRQDIDKTKEEREARAHETRGVRDMGAALTTIRPLETWRRDVPECNPDAFASWIVHCETNGKQLGEPQRMLQARQLSKNGGFPEQAEVVEYCISQNWKSLVPLADVRARRDGMSRAGPVRKSHTPSPSTADLEALEAARAR